MDSLKFLTDQIESSVRREVKQAVDEVYTQVGERMSKQHGEEYGLFEYAFNLSSLVGVGADRCAKNKAPDGWSHDLERGVMLCLADKLGYAVFRKSDLEGTWANLDCCDTLDCCDGEYGWKTKYIEARCKQRINELLESRETQSEDDNKREVQITLDGTPLKAKDWKVVEEAE